MPRLTFDQGNLSLTFSPDSLERFRGWSRRNFTRYLIYLLTTLSVVYFYQYLQNGLGLNYNDARSHLDIGRRVVEGLKPGLAQLGSVWLPLNHLLMVPLIWNDWMWHSGFAGAIWNMLSFVGTGLVVYKYLDKLRVGVIGRLVGVALFAANLNVLYLQSTAMTEIILLFTMTAGSYYLLKWHQDDSLLDLTKAAFWIMLATLVRYDGWFLLGAAFALVFRQTFIRYRLHQTLKKTISRVEGTTLLFGTLGIIGVLGWFLWNQLIFNDPLYFALGPFSAHSQQLVMEQAGVLPTKHNLLLSIQIYLYSLLYNSYTYPAILALIGYIAFLRDPKIDSNSHWGSTAMLSPFVFNVLALFLGFSVIYVQGISGETWFNIRYGVMLMPTIAIWTGYLVDRAKAFRPLFIVSLALVMFFAFANHDSVAIDDATVGSSQKNVTEIAGYLETHASDQEGFILISAASHDAIIFSSGLPMKRFIHEGTGKYWDNALTHPDLWARWIVMRTYDDADLTWEAVSRTEGFTYYRKVESYPFADVYELDRQYLPMLNTAADIIDNK